MPYKDPIKQRLAQVAYLRRSQRAGVCPCGSPIGSRSKWKCDACSDRRNALRVKNRDVAGELGVCAHCGKIRDRVGAVCQACAKARCDADALALRAGKCPNCRGVHDRPGKWRCGKCEAASRRARTVATELESKAAATRKDAGTEAIEPSAQMTSFDSKRQKHRRPMRPLTIPALASSLASRPLVTRVVAGYVPPAGSIALSLLGVVRR